MTSGKDEPVYALTKAVKGNKVFLAAVIIPFCLLAVTFAAHLYPDWTPGTEGSKAPLFLVFLLLSALEALIMPRYFVYHAARDYRSDDGDDPEEMDARGREEAFANLYAMAVLSGTTPCVLGLIIFFLTGNLWEGLALFAVGMAVVIYYSLRIGAVISRALEKGQDILPFDNRGPDQSERR